MKKYQTVVIIMILSINSIMAQKLTTQNATYDFGQILFRTPATAVFKIKNTSHKQVKIKEIYDKNIYDLKTILLITVIFMAIGFVFSFTYFNDIVRYALIIGMFIIAIVKRNFIIDFVKTIIANKKGE